MTPVIIWHPDGRQVLRDQAGWPTLAPDKRERLTDAARRVWNMDLWLLHEGGSSLDRPEPAHLRALSPECPRGMVWDEVDHAALPQARAWQQPHWPEDAAQHIDDALTQVGRIRTSALHPVHSNDLVSVIQADTTQGIVYFKASHSGREAAVTAFLARHHPDLVPPLLWADEAQGMILSASGGELLDAVGDIRPWEDALRQLARFQLQADPLALATLDCPGCALAEMADQVDALLGDVAVLKDWGVKEEDRTILEDQRPAIRAAFRALASLGLPDLPAHGDAHPRNALSGGRGSVWFDWSEARSAAHPFLDAGWFLWWTLQKPGLPVAQAGEDLGPHLARTYLKALGCPEAQGLLLTSRPLALLQRAVAYDAQFRHWKGTIDGWRPLYVPYVLRQAARALLHP
ncbi:hypothetical protein [Deinococcus navajonensis]|uniref:Aminoglycoside phosphotransferase domain-containing protein n=1 Tax=Deinococcus navajonensis TaxID=309884 RepID=A0ABV8XJ37_9DEIO